MGEPANSGAGLLRECSRGRGGTLHKQLRPLDERPLQGRPPTPDLAVVTELDPPAERVDAVAFVAKVLASVLGAEGVGDALVGGISLPVDAV